MDRHHEKGGIASTLGVLGLTPLESEVYTFLLGESPATGYRVAQGVGKSIGSVYKTLEALESKGAIAVSDDAGARVVRAVAVEELFASRRRELDAAAALARAAIESGTSERVDELVYRVSGRNQALERAAAMLAASTDFCIVIATPGLVKLLRDSLQAAAGRAVHVGLKAFAPVEIPGVRVALDPRGLDAVVRGPGEWLVMTADASEMLHAVFDHSCETLHTGTWTAHTLLNWSAYTGMSSDFILAAVRTAIAGGADAAAVGAMIAEMVDFQTPRSVAKRRLMERYRGPNPAGRQARSAAEVVPARDAARVKRVRSKGGGVRPGGDGSSR